MCELGIGDGVLTFMKNLRDLHPRHNKKQNTRTRLNKWLQMDGKFSGKECPAQEVCSLTYDVLHWLMILMGDT